MKVKKNHKLFLPLFFLVIALIVIILIDPVEKIISSKYFVNTVFDSSRKYGFFDASITERYISPEQNDFDVLHYSINLEIYRENESIRGNVGISGKAQIKPLSRIVLNFEDGFEIESLSLNERVSRYEYSDDKLTIPCGDFDSDTFNVEILYRGKPESLGFGSFRFIEEEEKKSVYSLNEPIFASTWFPCSDRPNDKALADIIITDDPAFVSVSNGILIDSMITENRKTYHWKTYYPISTYLIAVYSAEYKQFDEKYVSITGDTLELKFYSFPKSLSNARVDFSGHGEYLAFFERKFGEYPFINEKYGVAEFMWEQGAMEHQTITGMASNFISGRNFFKDIYIHELAHQWWGNAVGPESWKDVWLNEGFASYSEALYWEWKSGKDALNSTMAQKFDYFDGSTLYDPSGFLFSRLVYDKGAWVLHMLRRETGDSLFFEILRNYYLEYRYKNASTNDFKNICERYYGSGLDKFFEQWVFQGKGILEIEYMVTGEMSGEKFLNGLHIEQIQEGYKNYSFPLDVEIGLNDGTVLNYHHYITTADTTLIFTASSEVKEIIMDPGKHLLANFLNGTVKN